MIIIIMIITTTDSSSSPNRYPPAATPAPLRLHLFLKPKQYRTNRNIRHRFASCVTRLPVRRRRKGHRAALESKSRRRAAAHTLSQHTRTRSNGSPLPQAPLYPMLTS